MPATKEYLKSYYEKNKQRLLEEASELIMCGACCRMVRKSSLSIHRKSKICLKWQEKVTKIKEIQQLKQENEKMKTELELLKIRNANEMDESK